MERLYDFCQELADRIRKIDGCVKLRYLSPYEHSVRGMIYLQMEGRRFKEDLNVCLMRSVSMRRGAMFHCKFYHERLKMLFQHGYPKRSLFYLWHE